MNHPARCALALCFALCVTCFAAAARSQTFPSKPIRLIVATAPGPGVDFVARTIAPRMQEELGQPLVIENQAGANGIIGTGAMARSAPDGYTMVMATPSMVVTARFLVKNLPYDPVRDLAPVSCAVEPFTSLIVNPSVPASTVRELIDWVKKNPGKVSYGSAGVGSVFHMVGELFNQAAGTDIVHVPYKSVPPAVQAVMSGEVPMTYAAVSNAVPQTRAGKVRIVAILEKTRYPGLPNVPTVGETLSGFEKPPSWFGYLAPGATPPAVIGRLNAAVVKSLASPEVRKRLEDQALNIIASSPEQFAAMIKAGFDVYARAIQLAGLKPE
ncbi:MAG: tripartite tricarboxylate transporter substrate binding protein [Burkholderiales bacterium]|nr:tripartite tricarboxylate transporter substrate binding protein [Burkholderiales bacterium]